MVGEVSQRVGPTGRHIGVRAQVERRVEPGTRRQALPPADQCIVQQPVDAGMASALELAGVVAGVKQRHRHQRARVALADIVTKRGLAVPFFGADLIVVGRLVEQARRQGQPAFERVRKLQEQRPPLQSVQKRQGLVGMPGILQPAAKAATRARPERGAGGERGLRQCGGIGRQPGVDTGRPCQHGQRMAGRIVEPIERARPGEVLQRQQGLLAALRRVGQSQRIRQAGREGGALQGKDRSGRATGEFNLHLKRRGLTGVSPQGARHLDFESDLVMGQAEFMRHVLARQAAHRNLVQAVATTQAHCLAHLGCVGQPARDAQPLPTLDMADMGQPGALTGLRPRPGLSEVGGHGRTPRIGLGEITCVARASEAKLQCADARPPTGRFADHPVDPQSENRRGRRQCLPRPQWQLELDPQGQLARAQHACHVSAPDSARVEREHLGPANQRELLAPRRTRIMSPADDGGAFQPFEQPPRSLRRRRRGGRAVAGFGYVCVDGHDTRWRKQGGRGIFIILGDFRGADDGWQASTMGLPAARPRERSSP
jgi:hypothetical protein